MITKIAAGVLLISIIWLSRRWPMIHVVELPMYKTLHTSCLLVDSEKGAQQAILRSISL